MRKLKKQVEDEIQLNLTPMMDLFVALIPFLILSASFNSLGGIDLQAPAASSNAQTEAKKSTDELWLMFEVHANSVTVQGYEKNFGAERPKVKGVFNLAELDKFKDFLISLEGGQWKMGPSLFHASPDTRYEQAVSFLNVMRGAKSVTEIVMASGVVE
jgi:biopolymer transport protein ExbD